MGDYLLWIGLILGVLGLMTSVKIPKIRLSKIQKTVIGLGFFLLTLMCSVTWCYKLCWLPDNVHPIGVPISGCAIVISIIGVIACGIRWSCLDDEGHTFSGD